MFCCPTFLLFSGCTGIQAALLLYWYQLSLLHQSYSLFQN